MLARLISFFGRRRRRTSTHLTPAYEKRRVAELRRARAIFEGKTNVR